MRFDPTDNLFGAGIGAWIWTAAIFGGAFLVCWWVVRYGRRPPAQEREETAAPAEVLPPPVDLEGELEELRALLADAPREGRGDDESADVRDDRVTGDLVEDREHGDGDEAEGTDDVVTVDLHDDPSVGG